MYQPNQLGYTVALQHCREIPDHLKIDAEVRFARELEDVLGGREFVSQTYAAWLEVVQSDADRIDRSTVMTAARWRVAVAAATQSGFSRLGDVGDAHFEVRLERHAA